MGILNNMRLGTKLGVGFATLLALMTVMIAVALSRFLSVGTSSEKIINVDWVKADAAASLNAAT
ncbi:MAG: methyl-accepting chemotaxis protein, partial [Burkholderiales bacterium]|nr:methyl-accepting chemotaxis protein [Burkholderiales bacterium]